MFASNNKMRARTPVPSVFFIYKYDMKLMKKYISVRAVDVVNLKISGGMDYFGYERPF